MGHSKMWPIFMLNKEALNREIYMISKVVNEIDLALAIEDLDPQTKQGITSARGQLKAARSWLCRIYLQNFGDDISKARVGG